MTVRNQTSVMKVENTTFMIERLAQDCSPYQYIRELTQNSFDAIRRNQELNGASGGTVVWDVDWTLVSASQVYKLQISDDGIGMTPSEVERYINRLSSSTGIQSLEQNFGIGAKITAGVENPLGLVYKSWSKEHPDGIFATLWKDPDANAYGLRQYEVRGNFQHWAPLPPTSKLDWIKSTGTSVVLMGKSVEENTYLRPNEKLKWLISYLNERYFELPSGITVKVREFANSNLPKTADVSMGESGSQLRTIKGKKAWHFELIQRNNILLHPSREFECCWWNLG
jgi:hypothetical protein